MVAKYNQSLNSCDYVKVIQLELSEAAKYVTKMYENNLFYNHQA